MSYSFEETKLGYANLWDKASIRSGFQDDADANANRIISNKARYQTIEATTEVPWYMIGVIHYRESTFNFNTYLGNGQPLNQVTTLVPKGRGPFASFEAGAIDAFKVDGMTDMAPWSLEMVLYWLERYNGQGYFNKSTNSPYLWSWTTEYSSGKYVSDGVFDASAVDKQGGCAAILKALFAIEPTAMPPRIAQEKPMATTTTTPAAAPQIDLTQIVPIVETVIGYLPMIATFVPPLAPVVPFIPIIKGGLDMLVELQAAQHTPQGIADVITKHLGNIVNDINAIKGTLPVKPVIPPAPGPSQNTTGG